MTIKQNGENLLWIISILIHHFQKTMARRKQNKEQIIFNPFFISFQIFLDPSDLQSRFTISNTAV